MQAITPTHIIWLKRHLDLYSFNDERANALRESIIAYDEKKQNRNQAELIYEEFLKLFSNNMFYYGFKKTNQSITSDQFDAYLVYNKYNALTPIGLMREVKGEIAYPYDKAKCEYENALKEQEKQLKAIGANTKKKKFFANVSWRRKPMLFRTGIAAVLLAVLAVKLFLSKDIMLNEIKNGGVIGKVIWGVVALFVLAGIIGFIGEVIGVIKWALYNRSIKWADITLRDYNEQMDEVSNRRGMTGGESYSNEVVDDWVTDFRVQIDEDEETAVESDRTLDGGVGFAGPRNAIVWKETDKYQVKLVETMGRDDRTLPLAERTFAAQKSGCEHHISAIKRMWKKGSNWKKSFRAGSYVVLILTGIFLFVCVGKINYCDVINTGIEDAINKATEENLFKPDNETSDSEAEADASEDPYAEDGNKRIKVVSVEASSERESSSISYKASNVIDGSYDTCWQDGVEGEGVNESLTFKFENKIELAYITVCNGNAGSGSEYSISSRPKVIRLEFMVDGKVKNNMAITLKDEWKSEETVYKLPKPFECDMLIVHIQSTVSGSLNDHTSIAEIGFYGKNAE